MIKPLLIILPDSTIPCCGVWVLTLGDDGMYRCNCGIDQAAIAEQRIRQIYTKEQLELLGRLFGDGHREDPRRIRDLNHFIQLLKQLKEKRAINARAHQSGNSDEPMCELSTRSADHPTRNWRLSLSFKKWNFEVNNQTQITVYLGPTMPGRLSPGMMVDADIAATVGVRNGQTITQDQAAQIAHLTNERLQAEIRAKRGNQ